MTRSIRKGTDSVSGRRLVGVAATLTLISLAVPSPAGASAGGVTPGPARGPVPGPGLHEAAGAGLPGILHSASAHVKAVPELHRAGDGDPDPHLFGVDGKVGVHGSATSDDMLVNTSLYPDGRIVASGFGQDDGVEFALVTRRLRNGLPDPAFGAGTGIVSVPGVIGSAQKVVPLPDGGLVGVGYTMVGGQADFIVFRLDDAGNLVQSFGRGGIVRFPTHGDDLGSDVVVQPNGRIVVAGSVSSVPGTSDISVRRLLPHNGALDHSFDLDGEVSVDLSDVDDANAVTLQRDGRIVVVGMAAGSSQGVALRFGDKGSPDGSFGTDGVVLLQAGNQFNQAWDVEVQNDNKIAIVGFVRNTGLPGDAIVYRLDSGGRPDRSFNGTGHHILSNPGNDFGTGIGLGPDNSLVITSFQAQRSGVVTDSFLNRITFSGRLDPTFGTFGTVVVHNPEPTFELGLAIQPDGKLVVAGRRGGFGVVDSIGTINRYNSDGSPNTIIG